MNAPWTIDSRLTLNNGVEIPRLGLGVYLSEPGATTEQAVRAALDAGYRHVDTAMIYRNERDVGKAISSSGLDRAQVFVTTKLWNTDHGRERPIAALDASLGRLGLSYVDLYLVHWPVARLRGETWRAMTAILESGKAPAIGVSNYTIAHLEELLAESKVVPAVNQVELSPFLHQKDLMAFCRDRGIQLEAYAPLTQGRKLRHSAVVRIAEQLARTPAQVLIRWSLQHDLVVIPKSTRAERIRENSAVFDFTIPPEAMAVLDGLDEGFRTSWDPTHAP